MHPHFPVEIWSFSLCFVSAPNANICWGRNSVKSHNSGIFFSVPSNSTGVVNKIQFNPVELSLNYPTTEACTVSLVTCSARAGVCSKTCSKAKINHLACAFANAFFWLFALKLLYRQDEHVQRVYGQPQKITNHASRGWAALPCYLAARHLLLRSVMRACVYFATRRHVNSPASSQRLLILIHTADAGRHFGNCRWLPYHISMTRWVAETVISSLSPAVRHHILLHNSAAGKTAILDWIHTSTHFCANRQDSARARSPG